MATAGERTPIRTPTPVYGGPVRATFLHFAIALFAAALVTDIVYSRAANLMWQYFSIWMIAAGLAIGGFALLAGLISAMRHRPWPVVPAVLLTAGWITELVNAFVHSRDGWIAVVPQGLILSAIGVILVVASLFTDAPRHRKVAA